MREKAPHVDTAPHLPFEEEQVRIVVVLGEEVAEDPVGVTAADLVRGQAKVDTLDKVPQLRRQIVCERPAAG